MVSSWFVYSVCISYQDTGYLWWIKKDKKNLSCSLAFQYFKMAGEEKESNIDQNIYADTYQV